MKNIDTDKLVQEADKMLQTASEELKRSEEDVITHMVCMNARQSLLNYLIAYLARNGEELPQPVTIAGLMEKCKAIDGRFELIDLTPVNCRNQDGHDEYCLHVKRVSDCLRVARQTQSIITDESPAY